MNSGNYVGYMAPSHGAHRWKAPGAGAFGQARVLARDGRVWQNLRFALACLLTFAVPWGDMLLIGYGVQWSRILTLVGAGVWLFSLSRGQTLRAPTAAHLWMLLFVAWAAANAFWTVDEVRSTRRILSYSQLFVGVWLIHQFSSDERSSIGLFKAYLLGATLPFIGLALTVASGQALGDGRHTAPGIDPNEFGATVALGVPMAWHLAIQKRRWVSFSLLYIPCAAVAVMLTASRAALVTLAVAACYPLLSMPKISRRAKFWLAVLIPLTGLALYGFWSEFGVQRLSTIVQQLAARDLNGRVDLWEKGFAVFLENPLLGVGPGAFSASIGGTREQGLAAHNTFLEIAVELGSVGLMIFLIMLCVLWRRTSRFPLLERRLWRVTLIGWTLAASTLSWGNKEATWLLWALCLAQPVTKKFRGSKLDRFVRVNRHA